MKAQVQRGFGGPDVVALDEVPDPVPAPGEVLVSVRACALNRLDLLQRDAPLVRGFELPHIAGMDIAGVVTARAADLAHPFPAIGDAVIVDPVTTCGVCDRCRAGYQPYCELLRTIGSTRPGGFAERVAVPASNCYAIPDGMSFTDAACLPVAYMTAWHALASAGKLRAGETLLVNAASAGVSTALVQFGLAMGATVIGTVGGGAKVERARALGCHHVIDHRAGDLAGAVMVLTEGRGVDLVVDHVGPALFDPSVRSLAVEGRMVFCGTTTGTQVQLDLPSVYHWGRTLIGAGGYRPIEFGRMLEAVAAAGLTPVVDSVWRFDEIAAAQARMAEGSSFGKIVVTIDPRGD